VILYAFCHYPPTGTGTLDWDTFYDETQASPITGAALAAVLATLGLSHSSGTFSATEKVVLALELGMDIAATPGGADVVNLWQPSFAYVAEVKIPSPNTLGTAAVGATILVQSGEDFGVDQTCANGTDVPLTYAVLAIIRLA
jgi:hypothetical protein